MLSKTLLSMYLFVCVCKVQSDVYIIVGYVKYNYLYSSSQFSKLRILSLKIMHLLTNM